MFKEVLQSIEGIEIFPLIGLALFVLTFTGVVIWAWKLDNRNVDYMSSLPERENREWLNIPTSCWITNMTVFGNWITIFRAGGCG